MDTLNNNIERNKITPKLELGVSIKNMIDSVEYDDICMTLTNQDWLLTLWNHFAKHPVLKAFYQWEEFLDKETKNDFRLFQISLDSDLKKWLISETPIKLSESKFDCKEILNLINSTNWSTGLFIDNLIKDTYKPNTFRDFMTVFLITQLKDEKIDLDKYVNERLLDEKWYFSKYSWFKDKFSSLNWKLLNWSSWQNHRLAAIFVYNYFIDKLDLKDQLKPVEYISSKYVELEEKKINWEAIDKLFENNYVVRREDLDTIVDSIYDTPFDDRRYDAMDKLKNMDSNKDWRYAVLPKNKVNEMFNSLTEQVKTFFLYLLNKKPKSKELIEKITELK